MIFWKKLLFTPIFKGLMLSETQDTATGVQFIPGAGAPTVTANNGSVYFRTDGAAGTTLYLRISAAWVAVPGIGGGGSFTTLAASGATALASTLSVAGAATLNGNVTLGNATSDDITVTGRLASSVLPKTTNLYDLGSTSLRYAAGWFAGAVTAAGGFVGDDLPLMVWVPASTVHVHRPEVSARTAPSSRRPVILPVPGLTPLLVSGADLHVPHVGALRPVTAHAGDDEVREGVGAALGSGDDVVDLELGGGLVAVPAVPASKAVSGEHLALELEGDGLASALGGGVLHGSVGPGDLHSTGPRAADRHVGVVHGSRFKAGGLRPICSGQS